MISLEKLSLSDIQKNWNKLTMNQQYIVVQRYPLLKYLDTFDHSEIIINGEYSQDIVFNGPLANRFYYKGNIDKHEFERLFRAGPKRKFLVYDFKSGFITETRKHMDAESYLNKNRILVWREN